MTGTAMNPGLGLFKGIELPDDLKHVIGIEDLTRRQTQLIVEGAAEVARRVRGGYEWWDDPSREQNKVTTLSAEGSTRTVGSFDRAGEMLRWNHRVVSLGDTSMAKKRETWIHSARTWATQGATVLAMRTTAEGPQKLIAENFDRLGIKTSIINMGDGWARHPTQALLDLATILSKLDRIDGIKIGFLGDALRGRTIHSLLDALSLRDDISVVCVSPENLKPPKHYQRMFKSFEVTEDLQALADCDVVYVLRTQQERPLESGEPIDQGYQKFRITAEVLRTLKPNVIILHAQPVDGVELEIDYEIEDDPRVVMWEQNESGIYTRMCLLEMCRRNRGLMNYHKPVWTTQVEVIENISASEAAARQASKDTDRFQKLEDSGAVVDHLPPNTGHLVVEMLREFGEIDPNMKIDVSDNLSSRTVPGKLKAKVILRKHQLSKQAMGLVAGLCPSVTISMIQDGTFQKMRVTQTPRTIVGIGKCPHNKSCVTVVIDSQSGRIKEPGIKSRFTLTEEEGGETMAMCEYCRRESPLSKIIG